VYKEIREETGYVNVEIQSEVIEHFYAHGYRKTKNNNQKVHSTIYHVKILDGEKVLCEVEDGKHIIDWFPKEEIANKIDWAHHQLMREMFNGKAFTDP